MCHIITGIHMEQDTNIKTEYASMPDDQVGLYG